MFCVWLFVLATVLTGCSGPANMQSNVEVGERIKFVASNSTTATYRVVRLANETIAYKWEHGDLTSAEVNYLHSSVVKEYVVLKIRNAT